MLVRTLIQELGAENQIVLVSPDTDQTLADAKLGDAVKAHISWSPTGASTATAQRLAQQIAGSGVDIAHFHFGGNFAWSNRFPARCPIPYLAQQGVPVVTTIHMAVGLLHGYCGAQKPFLFKLALLPMAWLNKMRVLRSVRREITVSQQDCDRLRSWYWPVANKFECIYHSRIQQTKDAPAIARDKVILGVGHLAQRKGQLILAEAFLRIAAKHGDWKLQLAGHAAEADVEKQLQSMAARCPQIALLGQREDTPQLMQRTGIYVQPSFHEGLPLSLQEALYYGCACVATRIPGNIELVEHERNGLLVPPGDATGLGSALERLIVDEALRSRLAGAGRASILEKEMTIADMARKHRALYDETIKQR